MKKLSEQTIVITGASSGIGLATARMAAQRGARVVLSSRNEPELRRLVDEIRREGGQAIYVAADVADEGQLREVADAAIRAFGGIDTWVNNAGVSIYGRALEVPLEDQRRLFDANFWGAVHGARVALPHLRGSGGTLINVGSTVSERSIPLQSAYSASKHAMKAWMDSLRMELEEQEVPVAVVSIEPGSIDTPFPQHARNYMDREPRLPPPVYAPEVVARAILAMAEKPKRQLKVGAGAVGVAMFDKVAPRLSAQWGAPAERHLRAERASGPRGPAPAGPGGPDTSDEVMERRFVAQQQTEEPRPRLDALYEPPPHEGETRGAGHQHALRHSSATWGSMHGGKVVLAAAAALGAFAATRSMRRGAAARQGAAEAPERPSIH